MTPKTRTLLPIATAALLALTGCAGEGQPVPTVTVTETATATPEPPAEKPKEEPAAEEVTEQAPAGGQVEYKSHGESPRGSIIKHVGDWGGMSNESNEVMVDFRIVEIIESPKCTSGIADKPKNGRFVQLQFEVITYPELKDSGDFWITGNDFTAFTADGTRINDPEGNGFYCLSEADALPGIIGPGQKVNGGIVLDLPESATVVQYTEAGNPPGWEWPLNPGDGA